MTLSRILLGSTAVVAIAPHAKLFDPLLHHSGVRVQTVRGGVSTPVHPDRVAVNETAGVITVRPEPRPLGGKAHLMISGERHELIGDFDYTVADR